jgi:hypothetical protein
MKDNPTYYAIISANIRYDNTMKSKTHKLPYSDTDPLVLECKKLIKENKEPLKLPFDKVLKEINSKRSKQNNKT